MVRKHRYSSSAYIGTTTGGVENPVFYDPHTPLFNQNPPGVIVTGKPGSGKSFFTLGLAAISSILGKKTIVLDPKGDFSSLDLIKNELGPMQIWDLTDKDNKATVGLLDPFHMAKDNASKLSLAVSVIDIFIGGDGLTNEQKRVLSPIIEDVINQPDASLGKVVDELRASRKEEAKNLGALLNMIRKMNYANLCFAENRRKQEVSFSSGLTVITLAGMNIPKSGQKIESTEGNLVLGVIFLLADFIRRVMENESDNPKVLIIDEAWAVMSSESGAAVIEDVANLGRSKNLALVLATQNTKHFTSANIDIKNSITTRFAFKASKDEADSIVRDMDLPLDEGFQDVITQLNLGECLMQDYLNRYATVQISSWPPGWAEAFATNPLEQQEKRRKAEQNKTDIKI